MVFSELTAECCSAASNKEAIVMDLERVIPAISWLKSYRSRYFYFDLISGITLGVSMLPKAMAYALVAGLPPIYGLYASFVAPLVAILFGSNKLLFTGPVGVMTVLVFTALTPLAQPGSQEYVSLAALLSLIVGFIILIIPFLRLSFILHLISHAAVIGFVNAAAIIITATQVKHIFGVHVGDAQGLGMFVEILKSLPETNPYVLALSAFAFASMVLIKKYNPKLPEALIVLAVTSFAVYFLNLEKKGVEVIGALPSGLPLPSIPELEISQIAALITSAAVMAIVGMTESYSISKIIAYNTKQKVDLNQELIGQGLANIFTSFFQSYPVCGSFSGTSVNWSSGARTGMSIIIFSFLSLLSITLLTSTFYYLPKFMLAVIVILAVAKLFKPQQLFEIYRINKLDGIVAFVTFGVAIVKKPDDGIIVGVVLALALYVWNTMQTRVYVITKDRDTGYFVARTSAENSNCKQLRILKPEGPLVYVNAEHVRDEILRQVPGEARYAILDMAAVYYIDTSGVDALRDIVEELERSNVRLSVINLSEDALKTLRAANMTKRVEIHETKKDAISCAFKYLDKDICKECDMDIFSECKERRQKL